MEILEMLYPYDILALFILLPYFCYLSKRWKTWKEYFTYVDECVFHKWVYDLPPHGNKSMFRKCPKCKRQQYKVYTDSGLLSYWLELN